MNNIGLNDFELLCPLNEKNKTCEEFNIPNAFSSVFANSLPFRWLFRLLSVLCDDCVTMFLLAWRILRTNHQVPTGFQDRSSANPLVFALLWLLSFSISWKAVEKVNDQASSWNRVPSGVQQGSLMRPILFCLFVDDLHSLFSWPAKYVDDVHIAHFIRDLEEDILQHEFARQVSHFGYCCQKSFFQSLVLIVLFHEFFRKRLTGFSS